MDDMFDIVDVLDELDIVSPLRKTDTAVKASGAAPDPKTKSAAGNMKEVSGQHGPQGAEASTHHAFTLEPELIFNMQMEFPEKFVEEKLAGYKFKTKGTLLRALLHRTYKQKQRQRNKIFCDPLDFIGDFILKFIISRYLLEHCATKTKANLAHSRSIVECQEVYAFLAVRNGFHDHVFIDDGHEWEHLSDYVKAVSGVETLEQLTKVEKQKCFIHNFFQSVAGAIYVDSGYDVKAVEAVYLPMLKAFLDEVIDMDINN